MSKNYCPFLYGKFRKYFRIAAFAVVLGAAACAGSSDQSDEVVEAEQSDVMSEDTASNDEGSGLIIEQEQSDETGNDVPLVEDSAMGESESSDMAVAEEPAPSDDTEAVPDDIMSASAAPEQETPESLDATLDNSASSSEADDSSVMNDAIASEPVPESNDTDSGLTFDEPSTSMASTASFGQSSGVLPPGVIASPGAAIFIKSKYEKSPSTASASWGKSSGAHTYVVKPGDTVSGIAKKIYGSFAKTQALAAMNGISAPYIIQPGDVLKYDGAGASSKSFASSAKGGTVKVKAGDTLSKLAGELLGNPGAWQVLYDLNKSKISNPNVIYAGMVLSYNGSAKAATAKAKKWVPKKKTAPVAAPVEEPAVEETPAAEEPAVAETPAAEETETPVAEATEEEAPAAMEETDEVINVDLPAEDEE